MAVSTAAACLAAPSCSDLTFLLRMCAAHCFCTLLLLAAADWVAQPCCPGWLLHKHVLVCRTCTTPSVPSILTERAKRLGTPLPTHAVHR
jgi:hypothetical protein